MTNMMTSITRALLMAGLAGCAAATPAPIERYDVLIRGATIHDGSGGAPFTGDAGVRDGRIARVSRGPIGRAEAGRIIDAAGLVLAPGFIDLHAHVEPLLRLPGTESALRQGVTTLVGNPDGGGFHPIGRMLDSIAAVRTGVNVAFLVGHNTIRRQVMGMADRAPAGAELERMTSLVRRAMAEGAFGLSTGLKYLPGAFARTDEVIALARAAGDSGGIYTSHLREEGLGLLDGVAEAITIGREARLPVVLTHHKAVGTPSWGKSAVTTAMVDSAVRAGIDVWMDQYPYTATSTGIAVLVPAWANAGGDSAFRRRVAEPATRDSIRRDIVFNLINDRGGGDLSRVQFSSVSWKPELNGKTLADYARMKGVAPTPENGGDLVIEIELAGGASAIYHVLDERDVERIMRHPRTMIASDGRLSDPADADHPHPRAYGTFPRVLGRYVREQRVIPLADAIRKMTALPADRLRLADRGRIAEGMAADLVLFDPATVIDRATFERPAQYPDGIPYVLVNGVLAIDAGRPTGARAGRVLRREPGRVR